MQQTIKPTRKRLRMLSLTAKAPNRHVKRVKTISKMAKIRQELAQRVKEMMVFPPHRQS